MELKQKRKLNDAWNFWYAPKMGRKSIDQYEIILKKIGRVDTVEDFFNHYCNLKKPSRIPPDHNLMFFREGKKPMWEDCINGGCWIVQFKKIDVHDLDEKWEFLLFGCVGEEFDDTRVIGVVLSIRSNVNIIEVWLSSVEDKFKLKIGERLRTILEFSPDKVSLYFKEHSKSWEEKSTLKGAQGYEFVPNGPTKKNSIDFV